MRLNKNRIFILLLGVLSSLTIFFALSFFAKYEAANQEKNFKQYKKLSNAVVPLKVMEKALKEDIKSQEGNKLVKFTTLISLLAAKYYGDWDEYSEKDLEYFVNRLNSGETVEELKQSYKNYEYFNLFYETLFSEFIGKYKISKQKNEKSVPIFEEKYGLKAYSPIAYGFDVNFCDDFDNETNFARQKGHFGNDIAVKKGTPFVAVESGIVSKVEKKEYMSRVEIRSFDGKRTYVYANCGEKEPFKKYVKKGVVVRGGQILGLVGANNCCKKGGAKMLKTPYLHFGIKLKIQKEKEELKDVYVDVYNILKFLEHHKAAVIKNKNEYCEKHIFTDEALNNCLKKQSNWND